MPLFSEHMYYGSSSPYTGLPYSYSSSVSPLGSSYSAPYLNPGSSYNNHSSLSSYSRAPLSSRWITSAGRNYSPMLNTISERGSASPVRIHSPRRIPISSRTYGTPNYTPRPVNINTADIDVSRDRYRHKAEPPTPPKPKPPQPRESTNTDSENSPFMPRVDGKPENGIDSSPGVERSTIKRGRTVVRLYTIKRNSPRKPTEESKDPDTTQDQEVEQKVNEDTKTDEKEFMKWREKLSDDLAYEEKKETKTLGAKLVEKFKVEDASAKELGTPSKVQKTDIEISQCLPTTPVQNTAENKCLDRRCSMELLAEQANLLDSLIRNENLSTTTLDLSKVGIAAEPINDIETSESSKRRKPDNLQNPLKTTKSDHSLHDSLTSYKDVRDPRIFLKRRSIKKSSSGSCIRRLDSITEFPKELVNVDLPAIEECRLSVRQDHTKQKAKPKLKTKITSSVEISAPTSPLKFRIENVTVEEKLRIPKKEITYSSEVEEISPQCSEISGKGADKCNERSELASPEPEDGNFWNKIGKRETVYLVKRKQNIDEAKQKHQRSLFWFPEEEEADNCKEIEPNNINESNTNLDNSTNMSKTNKLKEIDEDAQKVSILLPNKNLDDIIGRSNKIAPVPKTELPNQQEAEEQKLKDSEFRKGPVISNEKTIMDDIITKKIPEKNPDITKETPKGSSKLFKEYEVNSDTMSSKECKNIGKSASLDAIDENKVKKSSHKKTKSEKTKKLLKLSDKTALKSLKSTLPKPSAKIEILQKYESSTIPEDASTNNIKLEQIVTSLESVQKVVIDKSDVEQNKKYIESQSPTQSSSQEKTMDSNTLKMNETVTVSSKNLPEVEQKQDKLIKSIGEEPNYKMQKTTTNVLMPSSEPSTSNNTTFKPDEQIITAQLSETKTLDVIKNDKISHKISPETKPIDNKAIGQNNSELPEVDKTDDKNLNIPSVLLEATCTSSNSVAQIVSDLKISNSNKNIRAPAKSSSEAKPKLNTPAKIANDVTNSEKTDEVLNPTITSLTCGDIYTSSSKLIDISSKLTNIPTNEPVDAVPIIANIDSPIEPCSHGETKINDVTDIPVVLQSQDIPNQETELRLQTEQKTGEENKADNIIQKDEQPEISTKGAINPLATKKKPVKEEKAVKPLIATPRPLQKKPPQVIHSSDSSDSSSEEESSEEEDEDDSEASEDSGEFYECDNNPDGRISTGSNDSGFDSSAPTSPATFSQIKKGGEASGASSSAAPAQCNNTDILEQELEQSTAYDIFRKTGRFTPPARSIPRFRKYTVEDFQFIKVLGKGSFGKVLLAELRDTEYYYAVKCLKKDVVLEDDDVECTLIERKVLALGTNHPYLCHLFATFQTDSHLFFVMEYLNGGDLMFHIQQSGRFPEARARFYAAEIVSGLKFLHKRGIVYRDLKLDNILLDFEGHVRIADFGMCKLQIYLEKTADTFCGTPDYMAPEIIKGLKYNQTVDWWSFGVLLYEMLIGQSPFSGCDEDELFWSICNEMPSYPRFLSQEALTILTRLLDKDARTRLGGTECMHGDIREQGFFHPIHWDRLERRELETPFRPRVRHPMDTQYFDKAFTGERPRLTAVEPHVLRSMDQEPFRGFSYTNPNTTDR